MYQVADGKIVRFWGEQDLSGLVTGLGMLPGTKLDSGEEFRGDLPIRSPGKEHPAAR